MPEQKALTVRELIAALETLPEADKDKPVFCYAEAGCTATEVYGVAEIAADRVYLDGW